MAKAKIRSLILGVVALVLSALPSFAQTSPNWTYGYVPTPAQWNAQWASKQDYLGASPCLVTGCTFSGEIFTTASTPSSAGLNVPPGAAPTSPINGDIWSTTAGLFVRINSATVGPLAGIGASGFSGTSPISVTFPAGVVNYAFDFTIANTFLAQQINQGATTTSPGWYAQIAGDTFTRMHVGLNAVDGPTLSFGPGNAARDTFLQRDGPAAFRLGAPDAAAPIAQTLNVQDVVAGTANTSGVNFTIQGSKGTGTGVGGSLIFQTAPASGSGSAQNSLVNALTIFGSGGLGTAAATDQGSGTLNLAGSLFNNGSAPTGTGGYVRATSPSLITPSLGVASATSIAINGCTIGTNGLCISGTESIASSSALALAVGLNGSTNPALQVDASTASSTTGIIVKSAAAAGGVLIQAISSVANEGLSISAKGSGAIAIGSLSSGAVTITPALTLSAALTYGGVTLNNSVTGTGSMVLGTAPSISGITVSSTANFTGTFQFGGNTMTFPGSAATLSQTIASGTSAMGTGAISSGSCATVVTTSATNTATTDAVIASFNSDPTAVTGYVPTTNGMLTIIAYPTANNVNFKVCNNTNSSITPGAITLNWRVVR